MQSAEHKNLLKAKADVFSLSAIPKDFDAKEVFEKAFNEAKTYPLKGDFLLIKSSKDQPDLELYSLLNILHFTIPTVHESTCQQSPTNMGLFEKLSLYSPYEVVYYSGFILSASRRFDLVLAGDLHMITILLLANKISNLRSIHHDHRHFHLYIQENIYIKHQKLIEQLDYRLKTYYVQNNELEALI